MRFNFGNQFNYLQLPTCFHFCAGNCSKKWMHKNRNQVIFRSKAFDKFLSISPWNIELSDALLILSTFKYCHHVCLKLRLIFAIIFVNCYFRFILCQIERIGEEDSGELKISKEVFIQSEKLSFVALMTMGTRCRSGQKGGDPISIVCTKSSRERRGCCFWRSGMLGRLVKISRGIIERKSSEGYDTV